MAVTSREFDVVEAGTPAASAARLSKTETTSAWQSDSKWHKPRIVLAVLFSIAMITYSVGWMYYIRKGPVTTFGVRMLHSASEGVAAVQVDPRGQAARAGVEEGDTIITVNGHKVRSDDAIFTVLTLAHPGDHVQLGIRKATGETRDVELVLAASKPLPLRPGQWVVTQLVASFPVLFVLVAVPLLVLRVDDRNAWMVAICFAGMIAAAPIAKVLGLMPAAQRSFMAGYMLIFYVPVPSAFYYLFATFPVRSPIDTRLPWLKNVLLFGSLVIALPLAGYVIATSSLESLWPLVDTIGRRRMGYAGAVYAFSSFGFAFVSLLLNSFGSEDREARRKTRVIVWGTIVGNVPWLILMLVATFLHLEVYNLSFWIWAPCVMLIFLMPLSFAYAVLKHRVLDVPVLLRRSARYLLVQRGFLILILVLGVGATLALAQTFSEHYPSRAGAAIPVGTLFGIALVVGGTWIQQQVSHRVDKAFFRSAYDTRQILEDLLARTRDVRTREQLCELLTANLTEALRPSFLLIYLAAHGELALRMSNRVAAPDSLSSSALLDDLFERGEPREVLPQTAFADFARIGAEFLVPIRGRDQQKLGLLVLGPRLSEEPYSREDRRLLALIATSAGGALEHITLAEDIAARMEAEKRAAHEIELARQVQRKLFPQNPPKLQHLDYDGECVQARVVGGDYYDFLELAPGQVGFALADISGKGFAAALLMANLQANLRGQYAVALEDLPGLMRSVNRLFFENSEPQHYATMFFGIYDDDNRKLRYVNCGHNPPLLLRANGSVEQLCATALVLGLFPEWDCEVAEVQLASGDVFVLYTDGVTEASSPQGEEYGDERVIEALRRNRDSSASKMLATLVASIQSFSPGEQGDDLTAVIGKAQ